ncbi:MAG: FAD-linked oxidase C-terminal domain-containing protein [Thermonemataceae bacterium]|nr:FAD-linked oxidase C-terminal domain-containing protein [Thermonemataceae bacterium]
MISSEHLQNLQKELEGSLYFDDTMRRLYATDASIYRQMPLAVAYPKNTADLKKLLIFAHQHQSSLIPRTAGTSLAGQVVGTGIVVDVSKHFTKILEINPEEKWIRLEPGIIRNDLNAYLKPFGLFFGPETATQTRAMIGGMVGNNSCGSNSIVYGSTREHILEVKGLLANGEEVIFGAEKMPQHTISRQISELLQNSHYQELIKENFPKSSIPRRNTGYALDILLECNFFDKTYKQDFNLSKLICGSEGTLMLITELKLNLVDLPPAHKLLVAVHTDSVDEALRANLVALHYQPSASELLDHYILECTKANISQMQNRFFVKGEPQAILAVELSGESIEKVNEKANLMIKELQKQGFGHHYPIVEGEDIAKVWALRNAGLGLLSNIAGDAKPVCFVEDTAVDVQDLPEYIREFNLILKKYNKYAVHYAHAGTGELHLRPILNLKDEKERQIFRAIAQETADLVKKYKGSLSGEHGDGRVRGEFIKQMVGEETYTLFKQIKHIFDPNNMLNPHKIVDTLPIDTDLRYEKGQKTREISTIFNFDKEEGMLMLAEKCNGSGDCRKTEITGGTMCPSYMATRNEKDTTRARANILREILTHSTKENPFDSEQIKEVMDLCLSCKGCKSECPSNVDIGKMKAEFLQHYYEANGIPFRTKLVANFTQSSFLASKVPSLYNFFVKNPLTSAVFKQVAGFAANRSLPTLHKFTLRTWFEKNKQKLQDIRNKIREARPETQAYLGKVILFCDEFTNYNDTEVGIKTIELLANLGYEVEMPKVKESGRTLLSKGLLKRAKKVAEENIAILSDLVNDETVLVGIEPSAILSFRDEYLDLVDKKYLSDAQKIAKNTFLLDEFLANEIDKGNIRSEQFTEEHSILKVHGHCHQKALSNLVYTKKVLSLPKNYQMQLIRSGCCGMAGSFGYEKEHYEVSMKVGELVLFPEVRKAEENTLIVASGTSCRHQIKDGTGKKSYHLAEIMWKALKNT